jgi:hypothetical protein
MHREVGDGLILRSGRPDDVEPLAAFYADCIRFQDQPEPELRFAAWARDLLTRHPTLTPADALVVEDTRTGVIVSAALVVPQALALGGVRIAATQPELIATRPESRGRGLVRAMIDVAHARSAARGDLLQFIAGVPYFYRQFGYELAIPRGGGPVLPLDFTGPGTSPYRVRPMRDDDAPFAARLDAGAASRYFVTVPRDETLWRYEIAGHTSESLVAQAWRIVETPEGRPIAMLSHVPRLIGSVLVVGGFEVAAGVSWRTAWEAVLTYLRATGEEYAAPKGGAAAFTSLGFWWLGRDHPLYRVVNFRDFRRESALYVRVPKLADLLGRLRPVLERRLAESPFAGHSADLRLGFYRTGVRLRIEDGAVTHVEDWTPPFDTVGQEQGLPSNDPRRPSALFPDQTFLQLLFGHRSLDELQDAFWDCQVRTGETRALLNVLFPRQPSDVWPLL